MDILVKLTVPNYVYQFYHQASAHIEGHDTEALMADALSAYAGLISKDIFKERDTQLEISSHANDCPSGAGGKQGTLAQRELSEISDF